MKNSVTSQDSFFAFSTYSGGAQVDNTSSSFDEINTFVNGNVTYHFKQKDYLYDTENVADWFLSKGNLSVQKLQLLCYYAQAWYYALYGQKFMDADFKAGADGPKSEKIDCQFCNYGSDLIKLLNKSVVVNKFSEKDMAFLDRVWKTYGKYSDIYLMLLAKQEIPYIEASGSQKNDSKGENIIAPDSMIKYYRPLYEQ